MARYTGGWLKLHRKILDKEWIADDVVMLGLFTKLLLWANRKDGISLLNSQVVTVKTGQVVTSSKQLASKLKMDRRAVDRALARLESGQVIAQQVTKAGRIITLVNFEHYQRKKIDVSNETGTDCPTFVQRSTNGRPHSGEEKKVRIKKNHPKSLRDQLRFEAAGILGLAFGAVAKGLTGNAAREYIGERGWKAIHARYASLESFGDAYLAKSRKASPAIAEAQTRDALAAVLGTLEQPH